MDDPPPPAEEPIDDPVDDLEARARQTSGAYRRLALIVLGALGVLAIVAGVTAGSLYWAATAPVPEYEAVVEADPAEAEQERQALESQLSALYSDTQTLPEWSSRLTARQINAWLMIRLRRDFPGFLKSGLLAPRVMLKEGEATIAARSRLSRIEGIISLTVRPTITDQGELLLDILSAKIGRLSLPLDALVAQLRETPLEDVAPIRWSQNESRTAVVVDLERINTGRHRSLRLTGVDVRPGEILLRGESVTDKAPPTD